MTAQLIMCWLFLFTGDCEVVAVSPPVPARWCAAQAEQVRRRRGKFIMAYCTGAAT